MLDTDDKLFPKDTALVAIHTTAYLSSIKINVSPWHFCHAESKRDKGRWRLDGATCGYYSCY